MHGKESIFTMSNKEVVRKFYDSFKSKETLWDNFCHKDIEWITMKGMPNGGRYVGVKAILEDYFPKMLSHFNEFHALPQEFLERKDRVVVFGKYHVKSKSGKIGKIPFCHVYTLQDQMILKFEQHIDTSKIQEFL